MPKSFFRSILRKPNLFQITNILKGKIQKHCIFLLRERVTNLYDSYDIATKMSSTKWFYRKDGKVLTGKR